MVGATLVDKASDWFGDDLAWSHELACQPFWRGIYQKKWPTIAKVVDLSHDRQAQREGIDKTIILQDGREIQVDEKGRREDYGDVALELRHEFRDSERVEVGWALKPTRSDWWPYAILPARQVWFLPVARIQEWLEVLDAFDLSDQLARSYGGTVKRSKKNKDYDTINFCLPPDSLFLPPDSLFLALELAGDGPHVFTWKP